MDVAVLGAGNGGCGVAFDWAQHGHKVRLFSLSRYPGEVPTVAEVGGIASTGQLTGFAPIDYAGHDPERAVVGADVIFLVGPAYSTEPLTEAVAGYLEPGQTVVVCPTSCMGSLAFKRAAGVAYDDDRYLVGETNTLPYAVRITEPATVNVYLKLRAGFTVASIPRSGTERLRQLLGEVYPGVDAAGSVFQTTLQNGNPVIHPAVTIANSALIERTAGEFNFYEDGVTDAAGRLMQAVDRERLSIAEALGHRIHSEPEMGVIQGYMTEANYTTGYSRAPGFAGIKAQDRLDNRYFTEDVGYTLIFFADLAGRLGLPTPAMDAIITIASIMLDRDFAGEQKRTLVSLGIGELSAAELARL